MCHASARSANRVRFGSASVDPNKRKLAHATPTPQSKSRRETAHVCNCSGVYVCCTWIFGLECPSGIILPHCAKRTIKFSRHARFLRNTHVHHMCVTCVAFDVPWWGGLRPAWMLHVPCVALQRMSACMPSSKLANRQMIIIKSVKCREYQ